MKKFILISSMLLIPLSAFALNPMQDDELDKITAQIASAPGSAAPLAAPASDASSISGDVTPLTPPAALAGQAIVDGAYANDRANDVTGLTTFFVNTGNIATAPALGFF